MPPYPRNVPTEAERNLIRDSVDALRNGVEGFRTRRAQLEMIGAVARVFGRCRESDGEGGPAPDEHTPPPTPATGENLVVIEAGTGTGKSFGALVPGLVMAKSRGKRLVVSSSTVALQMQYIAKDVPTLQKLMPMAFTVAVAKGRRRHACVAKLLVRAEDATQIGIAEVTPSASAPAKTRLQELTAQLAADFDSGRWNGDRDELPLAVPDELWDGLTTDRLGCAGNRCPQFARCPFYLARQKLREADLIIANHDLVLAALEMDAGSVLPDPGECLFVFDEAHWLPAKVIDHAACRHGLRGAAEWVDSAISAIRDAVLSLKLDAALLREATEYGHQLSERLQALYEFIDGSHGFDDKSTRRFAGTRLPKRVQTLGLGIRTAALGMRNLISKVRDAVLERAQAEGQLATMVLSAVGFFAGRLENVAETWALMLEEDSEADAPRARWVERINTGHGVVDYQVCASPISGSSALRRLLWSRASGAVLMSATLSCLGTFDLFLAQAGLMGLPAITTLQVDSPFDYRTNAKLVIAGMRNGPKDTQAHTDEVIERLPSILTSEDGGALVLFASRRQMVEVYSRLPEILRRQVLKQGDMPKPELIQRHRAAIGRGDRSVLFGLQSLGEGLDLPGELCRHVVIVKVPFSVPDTPVEEVRREWIERRGGSYFGEVTLPEAGVRLKQWLGRLLRTVHDQGVVTVLDRRLVSSPWGKRLMTGLPDFRVVVEPVARRSTSARAVPERGRIQAAA